MAAGACSTSQFKPCQRSGRHTAPYVHCRAEKTSLHNATSGYGLKAVWTAAEKLGDLLGSKKSSRETETQNISRAHRTARQMSRAQVVASLKEDYNRNYFVSGTGSMEAYEPDCEFADPFASFRGTSRFKKNVSNLGGLAQDVKCDILDWREDENSITTKWRFSAVLDLPWRPLLAAKGGTTHILNQETGKVEKHLEMWDTEPKRVLMTLLKPTAKVATNQWERIFMALSSGDVLGTWSAISRPALTGAAIIFSDFFVFDLLRGRGLQGSLLGIGECFSYFLAIACLLTEAVKLAQGMQADKIGRETDYASAIQTEILEVMFDKP